jgi:hypothetical protein
MAKANRAHNNWRAKLASKTYEMCTWDWKEPSKSYIRPCAGHLASGRASRISTPTLRRKRSSQSLENTDLTHTPCRASKVRTPVETSFQDKSSTAARSSRSRVSSGCFDTINPCVSLPTMLGASHM